MGNAEIEEQTALNEMYTNMYGENLPENTKDTDAGIEVKMPSGWYQETPAYISTEDGEIVNVSTKVASVYAVSDGNGETVPVPKGFYYVGGTLDSGVVISDNKNDKNKYAGQLEVPSGISVNDDGELVSELQGNQFVWIPCKESEYIKKRWGKQSGGWDTTTYAGEMQQIKKYEGFYVARYEAGLATTIDEYTSTQTQTGTNQVYNLEGLPQSRAGQIPWTFIDWTTSKTNAESMYDTDYVYSGLITGTQWDVMLNRLIEKTDLEETDITSLGNWGNYYSSTFTYTGRYATYNNGLSTFSNIIQKDATRTKSTNTLLTTGASNYTRRYNIYDVAGNAWEWTEEDSHSATSGQYRVLRGGAFYSTNHPACYRDVTLTTTYTGYSRRISCCIVYKVRIDFYEQHE